MKVNILGRGLIPFIGTLAPVYKVDLGRKEITSICNFKHLRVYEVSSGKLITKSNVNRFFDTDTNIHVNNVVEKKVEPIVETPTIIEEEVVPQVVETIEPVIEPTDDDVLSNQVIIEEPDVEETNNEEEVVEEIEETTESNNEENKSNTFKKNKKKNRH